MRLAQQHPWESELTATRSAFKTFPFFKDLVKDLGVAIAFSNICAFVSMQVSSNVNLKAQKLKSDENLILKNNEGNRILKCCQH